MVQDVNLTLIAEVPHPTQREVWDECEDKSLAS